MACAFICPVPCKLLIKIRFRWRENCSDSIGNLLHGTGLVDMAGAVRRRLARKS